jgi:hypothetical protein
MWTTGSGSGLRFKAASADRSKAARSASGRERWPTAARLDEVEDNRGATLIGTLQRTVDRSPASAAAMNHRRLLKKKEYLHI